MQRIPKSHTHGCMTKLVYFHFFVRNISIPILSVAKMPTPIYISCAPPRRYG